MTTPVEVASELSARPRVQKLSVAEELLSVGAGVWMVIGLFLDGLAHVELEPETFFTPSHLVLYSGFAAATVSASLPVCRRHRPGAPLMDAVPLGHGSTIVGISMFGVGAAFDLVWHETIGIEVSNEALLSPTHLLLMVGAYLTLSGPLRTGWRELGPGSARREWWPAMGSLAMVVSIAVFFTSYLTPFGIVPVASFATTRTHSHALADVNVEAFEQLREIWGLAGILTTSAILAAALLLLVRPATPPPGIISVLFAWLALALPALGEFRQWYAVIAVVAAGLVTDLVVRKFRQPAVGTATVVGVTWTVYFGALAATGRLGWSFALWSGATLLAVLLAGTLGWLTDSARSSA